ncbi:DNA topoisomerase IB [Sphingobacterium phlebotomi]|uniref:DNA topoisomerase n=1 Tax=Sphingobacterium phlebotomi TaxID=2605433 RepID=A0A5D4GS93_9SPHI|nr:DNA topoisomerase IB [Sphingobacterium phlebotomi]TYR31228.1 DNA topoisomerase IB [Sphingobacterium phlebotomi]
MDTKQEALLELEESGLRYSSAQEKGYTRKAKGSSFLYLDKEGKPIKNKQILSRIHALVLPPAWREVWICASPNGHLQATGLDANNRKQYKYHPKWMALRSEKKFADLFTFGNKLPLLKKKVSQDLRKKKLSCDKVCALAIAIMDKTSFRTGNRYYEKNYGSYGLTTLRNKHIQQISSNKIFFKFVGKKGVVQQCYLREKALVRALAKVKDIPGQGLFQYYDEEGNIKPLDSGTINAYLKEAMLSEVSCKTFRTWNGCLLALSYITTLTLPRTITERKKNIINIIDYVAQELGNTRTVTRNYYIHPKILSAYESAELDKWITSIQRKQKLSDKMIHNRLMKLLCLK